MNEPVDAGAIRSGVHFAHCYQGDYRHGCKYGEERCPAAVNEVPDHPADGTLDFEERALAIVRYLAENPGDEELQQARRWACQLKNEMEMCNGTI